MEPTWAMIPAQSERRALDWSLVLASQGIETLIDGGEVFAAGVLVVVRLSI